MDRLETIAKNAAPAVDFWSVRSVAERSEQLTVRQDVAEAPWRQTDTGAMVTVVHGGGLGYAATSDQSESGLRRAFARATELAMASAGHSVFDYSQLDLPQATGHYARRMSVRPARCHCAKNSISCRTSAQAPSWTAPSSIAPRRCGPRTPSNCC